MTDELQKAYEDHDAYIDLGAKKETLVDLGSWRDRNMLLVRCGKDVFAIQPRSHGITIFIWEGPGKLIAIPSSESLRLFSFGVEDEDAVMQRKGLKR